MKMLDVKKLKKYYLIEIVVLIFLYCLPILMYPKLPSTIELITIFLKGFWDSGVRSRLFITIINSGLIITAMYCLLNENKKRTFFNLFYGYFIYLFFLISVLINKQEAQISLSSNMNDILFTTIFPSVILLFVLIYFIRRKIDLGRKIGRFILVSLGSVILFEILINFSPLILVCNILLNNETVGYPEALIMFVIYYFSILSGILLSIIDLKFFNYHK